MASYVYTGSGSSQESNVMLTDKVRIATTESAIHFSTGFPETLGTGNITCANTSPNVTGNLTIFTTELNVGAWIGNSTGVTVGIVQSIANNGNLILTSNAVINISDEEFTYNPYGVPFVVATANSAIIPANTVERSIIVGQGNVVAYLAVDAGNATPFSVSELGMPHSNTGTEGI